MSEAMLYAKFNSLVASLNHNIRNDENILEFTEYTIKNLAQFNFSYFSFTLLTELTEGQEEPGL
jgi:hypothetical protein